MLRNYIKVYFRSLVANKLYSFINIGGLAVGIATSILILLWVNFKQSYDKFFPNHEQLFQLKLNIENNGVVVTEDNQSVPTYMALREADARIKNTCITSSTYGHSLKYGNKDIGKEVMAVSEEFLEMFQPPMLIGTVHSLDDPYSIMLGESTAKEIFGDLDPIGQFIQLDYDKEFRVSGILKDIPRNSTFWFHALIPMSGWSKNEQWFKEASWDTYYWNIYAELSPDTNVEDVNANIRFLVKDHYPEKEHDPQLFLHPMDRWYLYDNFVNGNEVGGKIEYIRIFAWTGILILFIACINYVNLATARSERRSKEVGIRKCIGSPRRQLVIQFLLESFLISLLSSLIAIMVVRLVLPYYNTLVGERLEIDFTTPSFWLLTGALVLITGILAGGFPAFYFSSLKPVKVLKGKFIVGRNTTLPRKVLVTLQYLLAIFLVVSVVVIHQQLKYVKDRHLGYKQENLLMIACNDEIKRSYRVLKYDLLNSGVVEAVNLTCLPIDDDGWSEDVEWHGTTSIEKANFVRASTEFDYTKTMGIKILSGRDFSEQLDHDSTAILVNETAVRTMGFPDPLEQQVKIRGKWRTIVGVIEDVVMGSPFDPVKPTFVAILDDNYNHINIRLSKGQNPFESISAIKDIFKKYTSSTDEYQFANDRFRWKFESMELVGTLADLFAALAIFLTILGVLGLAAYTAEQRSKELAIRKVLGATARSLIMLLSNYFVRIVLLAAIISTPVSWWALDQYLSNYTYRIAIPWWVIPFTAVVICSITVLIVLSQVLKLTLTNPGTALKTE